jgi:ribonuclease BN (tRNA processing enzyme)
VLTHVPPWYDVADMLAEAAEVYDGELCAAEPGAVFEV